MALAVSISAQTALFVKLFGPFDPVTCVVEGLIVDKGCKVDTSGLYVVKITSQGLTYAQSLTVGVSALMKGSVSENLVLQNKFLLKSFVEGIVGVKIGPSVDPVTPTPAEWLSSATSQQTNPPAPSKTTSLGDLLMKAGLTQT